MTVESAVKLPLSHNLQNLHLFEKYKITARLIPSLKRF